ncbi:MAG: 50S ribosomal protein L13 [Pseudomonadota bacterium]|nr:50S ribosomal protein L13 [Pseudomonadota bacterium]MEC8876299.1 50S ribosomal protein L13 [Pseudomonadota bacterium]MED5338908.1 50S ribosomal protein L13 [Pseudomonadota bacterium]MEE3207085.1 50S ribosomal protein L13 [Pseudomonadota bacterium]MEE3260330.1 50S ribosomal protein L13 [Pseudomonadota bacterium]
MKTYMAKPSEIKKNHYVVDANGLVLGRMATEIAKLLRGKHKPTYTPNMDCGDDIIVINAEKVKLTGKKNANKTYYRHTGYPGGLKSQKVSNILEGKNPEKVVKLAIKRMIPNNPLGRKQLKNLKVYKGAEFPKSEKKIETLNLTKK